jgi:hypothetical protein
MFNHLEYNAASYSKKSKKPTKEITAQENLIKRLSRKLFALIDNYSNNYLHKSDFGVRFAQHDSTQSRPQTPRKRNHY